MPGTRTTEATACLATAGRTRVIPGPADMRTPSGHRQFTSPANPQPRARGAPRVCVHARVAAGARSRNSQATLDRL